MSPFSPATAKWHLASGMAASVVQLLLAGLYASLALVQKPGCVPPMTYISPFTTGPFVPYVSLVVGIGAFVVHALAIGSNASFVLKNVPPMAYSTPFTAAVVRPARGVGNAALLPQKSLAPVATTIV